MCSGRSGFTDETKLESGCLASFKRVKLLHRAKLKKPVKHPPSDQVKFTQLTRSESSPLQKKHGLYNLQKVIPRAQTALIALFDISVPEHGVKIGMQMLDVKYHLNQS